jgi:signal transduction histidine kinase
LFQEAKMAEVARILGDIGHDVKNLLMPVLCGASLLKDEIDETYATLPHLSASKIKASQVTCHEVIQMISNNAKRIQERVKEIADCVKGLTSPPRFAPCKLADVVASVFDTLKLMADEKGINLYHENLQNIPEILADEGRLFNAFYNLVNNAIAEVPSGGSITIVGKLPADNQTLHIEVKDTGRGMPAEIRDSLFSASAISQKKGGTGLGTKIVKDVVDAHHGNITVESEIGIGTTFNINLPIAPVSHPTP